MFSINCVSFSAMQRNKKRENDNKNVTKGFHMKVARRTSHVACDFGNESVFFGLLFHFKVASQVACATSNFCTTPISSDSVFPFVSRARAAALSLVELSGCVSAWRAGVSRFAHPVCFDCMSLRCKSFLNHCFGYSYVDQCRISSRSMKLKS